MSNTARLQLGFSPLSKTIVLAKMRDLGDGTKRRVGNDRGRDVTNEAAQLVWHLVMAEGGEINWELDDGSRMVLKAEKQDHSEYRHHDNARYGPKYRSGTSRLALHHVPYMAMAGFHFPETVEKTAQTGTTPEGIRSVL